jgi:hypothetical protein
VGDVERGEWVQMKLIPYLMATVAPASHLYFYYGNYFRTLWEEFEGVIGFGIPEQVSFYLITGRGNTI